jgi:hypothetical protein
MTEVSESVNCDFKENYLISPVITMKRILLQNEDDWDIIVRRRRSATRENIIALAKDDRKDFRYQNRSFDFKYFKSIINVIALRFPSIL